MAEENSDHQKHIRSVKTLAMVNVGIWAIAIIAMIFLTQNSPVVKKLFPILAGGVAVGVALITAIAKAK
jgi:hypothetical protein